MSTTTAETKSAMTEQQDKMVKRILFLRNPFDVLEVNPETPTDKVRRKYRRLTLLVHPDKCKHPQATEAAASLSKALAILEDPEKRKPFFEITEAARRKVIDTWERNG